MSSQIKQSHDFEEFYDINRKLENDARSINQEILKRTYTSTGRRDILKMNPSIIPAQWYVDYRDDVNIENDEGDSTFDGLVERMSNFERELSAVEASCSTVSDKEISGNFDSSNFVNTNDDTDETSQSDVDNEEDVYNRKMYVRRRSLSAGDTLDIIRQSRMMDYENSMPLSENILSRSLGNIADISTDSKCINGRIPRISLPTGNVSTDEKNKGRVRKSISVDKYGKDDDKHHLRRGGRKADDLQDELRNFQKLHKDKNRKTSNHLRFAQSLETLIKQENKRTNFFKKRFAKKNMGTVPEENNNYRNSRENGDSDEEADEMIHTKMYIDEAGDVIRKVEIHKNVNQSLGFYIKFGNGLDRDDGIFISRVTLGSLVDVNNLLHTGDEIRKINDVNVVKHSLEDVVSIMQKSKLLVIDTRSALPFQLHQISNEEEKATPKNIVSHIRSAHLSASRTTSSPSKIEGSEDVRKPRANTSGDDQCLNKKQHKRKSPKFLKNKLKIGKGFFKEADVISSSTSDSDESNHSNTEDRTLTYPSDSLSADISLMSAFTGKLAVTISSLSGLDPAGSDLCYCTIEVNDEFKAKTQTRKIEMFVKFDDGFDIDIRQAKRVVINVFKQQNNKSDQLISTGCILLQKLLEKDHHAQLLLATDNDVQMRLNVKFTVAEFYLKRYHSRRATGVFGFHLHQTLVTEINTIPFVVRKCVTEIERRGLRLEGIYRISGNARKKRILRQQFEEDSNNTDISDESVDCHVISGILKDYLRELPTPLITQETYTKIYNKYLHQNADRNVQRKMLADIIKNGPYVNRGTLLYIMEHLERVAENSEYNKMDYKNIAVCFGPVMMCPPISEMSNFKKQIDTLEYFLTIWPDETKKQNKI